MSNLVEYGIWLIPFFGLFQAALLFDNLNLFQKVSGNLNDQSNSDNLEITARVSILIPARNEENNIGTCLDSLANQTYKNLEVVVLDDCSEDKTKEIILNKAKRDSRFKLIEGKPTPEGWTGKNFACHQLFEDANTELLLFIDADTTLSSDAIEYAIKTFDYEKANLLCLWPRQIVESPGEKFMIPLMGFILLAFLPIRFVEFTRPAMFAAANGQFLLFDRAIYTKCGGHNKLKDEIMDDVRLSQLVKKVGGKVVLRDASFHVRCRMYHSFIETWFGFRKNIFAAFNGRFFLFMFCISGFALWHALPAYLSIYALAVGNHSLAYPMICQTMIGILMRLYMAFKMEQPYFSALLHPLAVSITVLLAIDSFIGYNWRGVTWKGRVYKRNH